MVGRVEICSPFPHFRTKGSKNYDSNQQERQRNYRREISRRTLCANNEKEIKTTPLLCGRNSPCAFLSKGTAWILTIQGTKGEQNEQEKAR